MATFFKYSYMYHRVLKWIECRLEDITLFNTDANSVGKYWECVGGEILLRIFKDHTVEFMQPRYYGKMSIRRVKCI